MVLGGGRTCQFGRYTRSNPAHRVADQFVRIYRGGMICRQRRYAALGRGSTMPPLMIQTDQDCASLTASNAARIVISDSYATITTFPGIDHMPKIEDPPSSTN